MAGGGLDFEIVTTPSHPAADPDLDEIEGSRRRFAANRLGGRQGSRALTLIAHSALALFIVATLIARWPSVPATPKAAPSVDPQPSVVADDMTLIPQFLFVAETPGPLTNHQRSDASGGQCPALPPGTSPVASVTLAVQRYLPGFRVIDSSLTLDSRSAPCDIEVRARDDQDRLAVIVVTAPPNPAHADQVEIDVEGGLAYIAVATTPGASAPDTTRWRVQVGVMSTSRNELASDQLLALADDPELLW